MDSGIFRQGYQGVSAYIGASWWVKTSIAEEFKETAELFTTIKRLRTQHVTLVLRMCIVQRFNVIQGQGPPSLYKDTAKKMHDLTTPRRLTSSTSTAMMACSTSRGHA